MYSSIIIIKLFTEQTNCVTSIFSSGSNYQRNVWLGPNKPCETWLGIAGWCVIYYFHNAWWMTFLWHSCDGWYHLKLEAETLKKDGHDTNFLPFFSFFNRTSHFLRSNNDRILVNVVNIWFYFSVMPDSLEKTAWCLIGTPLCHPGLTIIPWVIPDLTITPS